jgi:lon-related putative ATP-dependent protease
MASEEVSPERMRRLCPPDCFDFASTADLPPLEEVIGQARAMRAVEFGMDMESPGYHMFALGPTGTGKASIIRKFLERKAADQSVPDDWLYVNNFEDPDKPRALRLPAGQGRRFRDDMNRLVEELRKEVPQAFEGKQYTQEQERIEDELQRRRREMFEELEQKAEETGVRLLQTPQGLIIAPIKGGDIVTPDQLSELPEQEQEDIERRQEHMQGELRDTMRRVQQLQKEGKERAEALDRQVIGFAINHLIDDLKDRYKDYPSAGAYLDNARRDLLDNVPAFKRLKEMDQLSDRQQLASAMFQTGQDPNFEQYKVNLLVDCQDMRGAPVVQETNPTHPNLVGRIEHVGRFGALVTNFHMIKCGALHRANGGYLMVNAFDILTRPLAWDALKRALRDREIKIESMGEAYGGIATRTLDPEPIPLDIKVIVVGDPKVYYLLYQMDPDFHELFKVKADFDLQMDRSDEALQQYAQFIGTACREEGLRHFDPSGVRKMIEHSARLAAHQRKLATQFGDIADLIRQASYWAGKNGHELVRGTDVEQAVEEKVYRSNRIEQRLQELITEGTLLIDCEGEHVGQVNGLAVLGLGDYSFGKPSRVTARTHVGHAGVVSIDRETELGGRIHNKGALILAGYLGGKYAEEHPLALSASLTFEQLYEEVEGDSASSTELYALLSSLTDLPIRQDLAVTGSVNQYGQVQAIGGVNEKIEGFFDVCRARGLTGRQGVLIPRSNVPHLMLREDVVEAAKQGQFHIHAVETIDEGIALLTGREAGERGTDGTWPEGSVNRAVQERLRELAEKVKAFARPVGAQNASGANP